MKYTKEAWKAADERFKQMKSISRILDSITKEDENGIDYVNEVLLNSQCEKFG